MVPDFKKLFEYNEWANNKLVTSLKAQNIIDETVLRLFSHMVLSEQLWILRLEEGNYGNQNFWQILTLSECEKIMHENQENFKKFINKTDTSKKITYKNSKGIKFTNSISDILTHILFHATYHRGQIAKEVRRLNKEPVLTDYIVFIREKYA